MKSAETKQRLFKMCKSNPNDIECKNKYNTFKNKFNKLIQKAKTEYYKNNLTLAMEVLKYYGRQ